MGKPYSTIRVMVADDHEVFRAGLRAFLKNEDEFELVGDAENGRELVQMAGSVPVDVIITDIKMPLMDGIEATKILSQKFPHIPIIALTMFDDDSLIVEMMEAGAKGYLLKNSRRQEIIDAIKTVHNQRYYYCSQATHKLSHLLGINNFNSFKKKTKPELTNQETEIVRMICKGYSNKEIAAEFNLSTRTIEGHREKIHEKINIKSTAGIVIYAIKHGIFKI